MIWLTHPHANAYFLLPWLFLLAERLCRRGRLVDVAGLGAVSGLTWLGGHPHAAIIVGLPVVAWVGFRLASAGLPSGVAWRRVALATGAAILGLALGAIMLVPFFEALGHATQTSRGTPPFELSAGLAFLFPEFWDRPDRFLSEGFGGPVNFSERTGYLGAVPTLLAIGGLVCRRPRGPHLFVGLLLAVGLLIAFDSGPVASAVREVPVLSQVNLLRVLIVVSFAGALSAAYGLQRLLDGSGRERRRMLVAGSVLALVPPLVWLGGHPSAIADTGDALRASLESGIGLTTEQVELWAVIRWLVVGSAAAAIIALLARRSRHAGLAAGVAIGLTAVDPS